MSEEDVELLRAVREWRPPTRLHPIAVRAVELYEDSGMTLSDSSVEALRAKLDASRSDLVRLAEEMEGLTRFMIFLTEHQNDSEGGQRINDLLREYTPLFEPFWARVAEALGNVGRDILEGFRAFIDRQEEQKAPVLSDPAPVTSIPLSKLLKARRASSLTRAPSRTRGGRH